MSGEGCRGRARQGPEAPGEKWEWQEAVRSREPWSGCWGLQVLPRSRERAPGGLAPCLRRAVCFGLGSRKMLVGHRRRRVAFGQFFSPNRGNS